MLYATVRNRKIHVKKPDTVVQNGVKVDWLQLEMDDEWAEMDSIVCVFVARYTEEQAGDGGTKTLVEQEIKKEMLHTFGQKVLVPWEVLVNSGMLSVSCTGYVGSEKIMTTMYPDSFWQIVQNGPKSGDSTIEPTASLYDQIVAAAGTANAAAIAATQAREQLLQDKANGVFDGADGQAATVEVGTVITGSPEENAQVYATGTPQEVRLNFVIPRGKQGPVGPKGDPGPEGRTGPKGDPFTYSDFTQEQLASLKGDKGDTGPSGADGKSAYQYAKDGGYTGTEEEFAAKLANEDMAHSVKKFGAAGDGVTDDTAAFQFAFDSIADQGGNLYIPEGDYKITGQLTIADPICVSGDGCLKLYDPDSSADFAALTVDNGVRLSGLKLEAQEGFAGVILKYYPTSNSIYPSRTRFKSLILHSLSTQKIVSYFDVYGGNNYGLIIEDVTIGKPNTARYCQYGMRILTEGGYAGAGASWENSGTVRNLRIDTRGDHQLYAVGASGGVVPKNWVFENIAIQANSKLQGGNAFTYQDSFYLYRFAEVTLRNCKVWDASAAAYAEGRAPVVYEDIIATTYIDGCAPAFYLDSGAVVLSTATTPEITAYRQQYVYDQLKEIAEKFDISSLEVSKTETDAETTLIFSDGVNNKTITVSKLQPTGDQINAAISDWMDKNALPVEVWSKNVLNINDENVSMGYIASAGQINSSDSYWVSGYIPAKQGDVLRSSLNGAAVNFYYVAEYDEGKNFLYRNAESINTYTVSNESAAYIRVSWKTSLVSYKNEKAMLTLNNADLSFEEYGSHMEGGLGIVTGPAGPAGTDGKSAYAYAVEGGYTGTEAEFAAKMAEEIPTVDSTLTKSGQAADAAEVGARLSSLSEEIADCIKSPASAEVGQTIVVKAIGGDGKPTEWEPVTLPEQVQADWNQNDSATADYVKNRTHYEEIVSTDYVLNMRPTEIVGLSMSKVGETITVKINGVESVETIKEVESRILGTSYKYIGNIDADSLFNGGTGWCVIDIQGNVSGLANPDTKIAVDTIVVHKINDKFINFDGFVRTFNYYFTDYTIYKTLYNDDGDFCDLHMCNNFILPETDQQLFGFMDEGGFSNVGSTRMHSCFVIGFVINQNGSITVKRVVLGTNTTEMEELAATNRFTHTTNPKA